MGLMCKSLVVSVHLFAQQASMPTDHYPQECMCMYAGKMRSFSLHPSTSPTCPSSCPPLESLPLPISPPLSPLKSLPLLLSPPTQIPPCTTFTTSLNPARSTSSLLALRRTSPSFGSKGFFRAALGLFSNNMAIQDQTHGVNHFPSPFHFIEVLVTRPQVPHLLSVYMICAI